MHIVTKTALSRVYDHLFNYKTRKGYYDSYYVDGIRENCRDSQLASVMEKDLYLSTTYYCLTIKSVVSRYLSIYLCMVLMDRYFKGYFLVFI